MIWLSRGTTERFGTIATALLNLAMDNAHQQPEQNTFTEAELWVRLRFHFSRLILAESATEEENTQAGERQTMRKIFKQRLQLAEAGEWRFLIMLDRQREIMCSMQPEEPDPLGKPKIIIERPTEDSRASWKSPNGSDFITPARCSAVYTP